jgi:hypothetical protein
VDAGELLGLVGHDQVDLGVREVAGHEPPGHERADGEEGDVAEVEQAGEADDDVEPERHHHVGQRLDDRLVEAVVEL